MNSMTTKCMRRGCDIIASITCSRCNIVKYCSEECMRENLPGHSIICRSYFPDMLRAYSQHLSERGGGCFTLSYPIGLYVKYDGVENLHIIGFGNDFFCICCGKPEMRNYIKEIYLTNSIYYNRCIGCNEKDIRICINSYLDAKLCWRGLKSLMILREYILRSGDSDNCIPYEIFGYIVGMIVNTVDSNGNKIACIEHIFE